MNRALLFAISLVFAAACDDDGGEQPRDAGMDADRPEPACFENPKTHAEIINACTTAQKYVKKPTLPLLNMDGSLPALPP
jgi:hypothetical protein